MAKNILVIFNDDHGQWAMPAYGNKELHTPNLNWLSCNGTVFENAFTPTPVCSPARACFMTGRLASQHGLHDYIASGPDFHDRQWLKAELTLPEILDRAGYHCGLTGKWHLGNDMLPQPGFHQWFALSGDYPIEAKGAYKYSENGQPVIRQGYKTRTITENAIRFLREMPSDKPFFLFVGYTATHSPWADHPPRLVEHYRGSAFDDVPKDESYEFGVQNLESRDLIDRDNWREAMAQYYAAVTTLDEGVGHIMDEIEALGMRDDTLTVYTSDHGLCCGHHGIWGKGNGTLPLNMVEESIRIPLILEGCDIPQGQRMKAFVDHLDSFQTLIELSGADISGRDTRNYAGRSFLPLLQESAQTDDWRDLQFCEYGPVRMARSERYKLVMHSPTDLQLFDLNHDPRECQNLAALPKYDDTIRRLSGAIDQYFNAFSDPDHNGARASGPLPSNFTSPWLENPA